jgi:hypothetical protein
MDARLAMAALGAIVLSHDIRPGRKGPPARPVFWRPKYRACRNDACPCGSRRKFKRCCINVRVPIEQGEG